MSYICKEFSLVEAGRVRSTYRASTRRFRLFGVTPKVVGVELQRLIHVADHRAPVISMNVIQRGKREVNTNLLDDLLTLCIDDGLDELWKRSDCGGGEWLRRKMIQVN